MKRVLVIAALIASSQPLPKADALSISEAYKWLNTKHDEREIKEAAKAVVETAREYQLPSLTKMTVESLNGLLSQKNKEISQEVLSKDLLHQITFLDAGNREGNEIEKRKYYTARGLASCDTVFVKDTITITEDDESGEEVQTQAYVIQRESDTTDEANKERVYTVPTYQIKLQTIGTPGNTCRIPEGSNTGLWKGGKRRKTLRRRK